MISQKKILLIDDEEDFCFFVKNNLTIAGNFAVSYATNSKKGIKLARKEKPDLILLDILMPKNDGFQVLKVLKNDTATMSVSVIMLTAVAANPAKIRASQLYTDDYIVKPVNFEELKTRIGIALKRRRGQGG